MTILSRSNHIFIVFHDLGLGGIQKKIIDIVSFLEKESKASVKIHLVLREKKHFNYLSLIKNKNCIIHFEPQMLFFRRMQKYVYTVFIWYLFFRYSPDGILVFSLDKLDNFIFLKKWAFWKKVQVIFSQDNILSFYNKNDHSYEVFLAKQVKKVYDQVDKVITQTEFAKKDLIEKFNINENNIVVIPNWFLPPQHKKNKTDQKEIDILFVGRFEEQKQTTVLLNVLKKVIEKRPSTRVLLVGKGSKKQKMSDFILTHSLSDNIKIQSPTQSVLKFIANSKILVLTSLFEGHPLVVLEAMYYHTIPVVLRYPGCEEYLEHGINSFIEKDQRAMITRIIKILTNNIERQKIGQRAHDTVVSKYNSSLIEKIMTLLCC